MVADHCWNPCIVMNTLYLRKQSQDKDLPDLEELLMTKTQWIAS